jgi:hypothetical protein
MLEALLFCAGWMASPLVPERASAARPPKLEVSTAPAPRVTAPAPRREITRRYRTGLPLPFPVFPSFPEIAFTPLRQARIDAHGFESLLRDAALRHAIPPQLVLAVTRVESDFDPHTISNKGALGLMQVMPSTGARFGVAQHELIEPHRNAAAGTAYLAWLLNRYRGDLDLTLAAYNAGEGAVDRYRGIPPYPETQEYVRRVREALRSGDGKRGG